MTVRGANTCTTSRRSTFMPWVSSMRRSKSTRRMVVKPREIRWRAGERLSCDPSMSLLPTTMPARLPSIRSPAFSMKSHISVVDVEVDDEVARGRRACPSSWRRRSRARARGTPGCEGRPGPSLSPMARVSSELPFSASRSSKSTAPASRQATSAVTSSARHSASLWMGMTTEKRGAGPRPGTPAGVPTERAAGCTAESVPAGTTPVTTRYLSARCAGRPDTGCPGSSRPPRPRRRRRPCPDAPRATRSRSTAPAA